MLPGGSAARAAPAIAAACAGSFRPMFRPRTSGVFVTPYQAARWASHGWVMSVVMPGGRGAPAGFHHVWSVESPPKRSVGGPLPARDRVETRVEKIGFTTPPDPM